MMMKLHVAMTLALFLQAESCWAIAISGTPLSSLNFGTFVQGDFGIVVPSGTSETAGNASIDVIGDPNTAYSVILPVVNAEMTTGAGGPNETITFSSFTSFPNSGANGLLAPNGHQMLFIGATLNSLQLNQAPGNYSGSFMVTVTY